MSVVGIDFGSDSCFISIARGGGIETISNDYSLRQNPSFVAFSDRQRAMCVSAKNQHIMNLKRTFFGFKHLLGLKYDEVDASQWNALSYDVKRGENGEILVSVEYNDSVHFLTPVQLTAMLFTKLKHTAQDELNSNNSQNAGFIEVRDVVISVPFAFTDYQRRALLDAAAIAGLNVLKIMNDTTATALAYGIYKQDLPGVDEKARNIVFVDCGHQGIQVSGCSFNKGKLNVAACVGKDHCGGDMFNILLAKHFASEFQQKYKNLPDVISNRKAIIKLIAEAEKLKKQMSANTNKLPLNLECFLNDIDVSTSIDRVKFEEIIEPQLKCIESAMTELRDMVGWKKEDIYAVELVGGSSRVSSIKSLVEKVFYGLIGQTTLNADEAVSRGCALQCAILSPTFRVREFQVSDVQPYPIRLYWKKDVTGMDSSTEDAYGEMLVFDKMHSIPFSKIITFFRKDNFILSAKYDQNQSQKTLSGRHLSDFEVGEVNPSVTEPTLISPENGEQKVKVKVRINLNGIFLVSSASRIDKHEKEEKEEQTASMEVENTVNGTASEQVASSPAPTGSDEMNDGSVSTEVDPKQNPEAPSPQTNARDIPINVEGEGTRRSKRPSESNGKQHNGNIKVDHTNNGEPVAEPQAPLEGGAEVAPLPSTKSKTVSKSVVLPVTAMCGEASMSSEKLQKAIQLERAFISQDLNEKERLDAKNTLEEYLYDIRSKLSNELSAFVEEDVSSKMSLQFEDLEIWLYEDGEHAEKQVYEDKLNGLKNECECLKERKFEFENVSLTIDKFKQFLHLTFNTVQQYLSVGGQQDPKLVYDNYDQQGLEKIAKDIQVKGATLTKMQSDFANWNPKTSNAPVTVAAVESERTSFCTLADPILRKIKVKPVEAPPKTESGTPSSEEQPKEGAKTQNGSGENQPKENAEKMQD